MCHRPWLAAWRVKSSCNKRINTSADIDVPHVHVALHGGCHRQWLAIKCEQGASGVLGCNDAHMIRPVAYAILASNSVQYGTQQECGYKTCASICKETRLQNRESYTILWCSRQLSAKLP